MRTLTVNVEDETYSCLVGEAAHLGLTPEGLVQNIAATAPDWTITYGRVDGQVVVYQVLIPEIPIARVHTVPLMPEDEEIPNPHPPAEGDPT